jgi:adenylate cyclase
MQRKLTAILSADVVGYSGLMEADEAGTLERLKANRARIFDPHVTIHGGRVFKLIGDGALVEFPSVIAAVECALAIQDLTERAGDGLSDDKRIRYRIGINLGEVVVEGDDIYGEGVNVAARLQTLAPVGGVALSQIVKEQVEGKAKCAFDDMGEHTVKNIERPVHVYAARNAANGAVERSRSEPPRKISICVLPFANMSGDAEQEYFSDGISEDIITDLSKVSALSVIARNTAFQFKGKSINVPQVARQLNASHILEGSVRKAGGRVRITAQLIDGVAGDHIWAERYDRDLSDIFALQDEISEAIVKALKLKLVPEEKKAIERRGTENVDAYNLYLMARRYWVTGNVGDSRRENAVIRLCRRAVEIDPGYARAWSLISIAQHALRLFRGKDGDDDWAVTAERALALDPTLAEPHALQAIYLFVSGRRTEAFAEIEQALSLDPDSDEVNRMAARLSRMAGRFGDAVLHYEKVAALDKADWVSSAMLITCYAAIGDTEGARRAARVALFRCEAALAEDQSNGWAMSSMTYALAVLGEAERAKEWVNRALLIDPDNPLSRYNFACTLSRWLGDVDGAIELLGPVFAGISSGMLATAKTDPDLDPIRDDPRFKAMLAAADARLASEAGKAKS